MRKRRKSKEAASVQPVKKPRFRLFLPLYLSFALSILLASFLGGFIETYSLMPFDQFAASLRDNADRIAPFLDDAFNDRFEEGEGLPEQHKWLEEEMEETFGTTFKEAIEAQHPWFKNRHSQILWLPALFLWMLPVYKFQRRRRQDDGNPEPDRRAAARILNLPLFLLLLPVFGGLWKMLVEFRAVDRSIDLGMEHSKGVFFASFLLVSSLAGYFNLWFTGKYVNNGLARHIFTGDSLYDLKTAKAPGLTMRIFLMILSLAAIPIILNIYLPISFNVRWFSGFFDRPDPDFLALAAAVAPLFITFVMNASFLVVQIGGIAIFRKSIQEPVDKLIERMRAVAKGDFTTRSSVLSADEIGQLKGHFNQMVEGLEEREKIRDTFGKFVSMEIARKLLDDGDRSLAGEEIITTVMFTDIRSFTSFSEGRSPRDVIEFLNEYFSYMVTPIAANQGVVNKFIGDSIMAVFSPVFGLEDHATAALKAAVDMRDSLAQFNTEGRYGTIRHGVGIHTGPLVAGNVGAEERKEYTVIGDTVNVASRIESQTKIEGTDILVSKAVSDRLAEEGSKFTLKAHEPVAIRGKSKPYVLYSVPAD